MPRMLLGLKPMHHTRIFFILTKRAVKLAVIKTKVQRGRGKKRRLDGSGKEGKISPNRMATELYLDS
jgi:hypothetical protein